MPVFSHSHIEAKEANESQGGYLRIKINKVALLGVEIVILEYFKLRTLEGLCSCIFKI